MSPFDWLFKLANRKKDYNFLSFQLLGEKPECINVIVGVCSVCVQCLGNRNYDNRLVRQVKLHDRVCNMQFMFSPSFLKGQDINNH